MNIIIQAGGKGSRLEGLTWNKPKCLVSVNGLPILFYTLQKFPDANFYVIADYEADVLKQYLHTFAKSYKIKIIDAKGNGTISGIKRTLRFIPKDESFLLVWSDLIPATDFNYPNSDANLIGISGTFECRWSYVDNKLKKCTSRQNGVAGLFFFKDKKCLKNIPMDGEFVAWLQEKAIKFKRLNLSGWKEIGTILSFKENSSQNVCRPFNEMHFSDSKVIKRGKNEYGIKIGKFETDWYKHIKKLKYPYIPEIYSYSPLTMQKITGYNIFELDCLVTSQKEIILSKVISALEKLHSLEPPKPIIPSDIRETYFEKTFRRLDTIKNLVPFAQKPFLRINDRYYRNVFYMKEEIKDFVEKSMPSCFSLIHGDCTFSNILYDTFNSKAVLIDPRGYFGQTQYYGDEDYDWAKLYYSLYGNYDQFNRKKFSLKIGSDNVEIVIKSSGWECMKNYFLDRIPNAKRQKIEFLHALIWLSLTTYAWDDYDSICGAFYNGILHIGEILP